MPTKWSQTRRARSPTTTTGRPPRRPKRKALSPSPAPAEEPAQKRARVSEDGAPHGDAASATGGDDPSNGAQDDRPSANPESPVEPAPNRPRMPSAAPPDRRASVSQEEKKRGQRLFGGLIDTLSQTTGTSQQKRRLEIERRQQERAEHQKIEDDRRLAEKRAALDRERRIGQVRIDEQVVRLSSTPARCLELTRAYYLDAPPPFHHARHGTLSPNEDSTETSKLESDGRLACPRQPALTAARSVTSRGAGRKRTPA